MTENVNVLMNGPEEKLYNKNINKLERRKKKRALARYMKTVKKKTRKKGGGGGGSWTDAMLVPQSIRTHHEEIFESYLKLLGQPFLINQLFCFGCNNFYTVGDQLAPPKKCQVCSCCFTISGMCNNKRTIAKINYISRPDFILDFNSEDLRMKYRHDTHHHKLTALKEYHNEYMKKVSVVRIDGSIHLKRSQRVKDYHQYHAYRDAGVKVFIVLNAEIDELLDMNDNGRALLSLCKYIGDCTIDPTLYDEYVRGGDHVERTARPF